MRVTLFLSIILFLSSCGPSAQDYISDGIVKMDSTDFVGAIADFTKAIEKDAENSYAYRLKGEAEHRLGQYEEAISDYDMSLKLNPEYDTVYALRAGALMNIGRYEAAIASAAKAIQLNNLYAFAYYVKGEASCSNGDNENGLTDLKKAIELDANNEKYYDAILKRYSSNVSRYESDMARYLNSAFLVNSDNSNFWNYSAFLADGQDKFDDAIFRWEKAISLSDNPPGVWFFNLGASYFNSRNYQKAKEYYTIAMENGYSTARANDAIAKANNQIEAIRRQSIQKKNNQRECRACNGFGIIEYSLDRYRRCNICDGHGVIYLYN